jgi:hypothetical protein
MPTDTLLEKIIASPRLLELFGWPWDFDVTAPGDASWFKVKPQRSLQVIAQDGTGGVYALWGDELGEGCPVLFVSSEGQAGVIAATLREALQMMIALPYWRDCLKFSGGGSRYEMQQASVCLEKEICADEPDIDGYRQELLAGLGLERSCGPLDRLHDSLTAFRQALTVAANDGSEFDSLFGPFVVEDNPTWKAVAEPA